VRWLNVHGLHDTAVLTEIGQRFHLHPLVMEDIANTEQRPKVEDYGDQLFIVARMLTLSEDGQTLSSEQCSLVLGENFLLSFQERPSGSFEPVRERLRKGHAGLRTGGVDLLGYSLIDALVDNYFSVVERIDERLDMLEEAVFERPASAQVAALHHARRDTLALRRALWPLREVISSLQRGDHAVIKPETRVYLRDVQDHLTFLLESVDAMRETLSGPARRLPVGNEPAGQSGGALTGRHHHTVHAGRADRRHFRHELQVHAMAGFTTGVLSCACADGGRGRRAGRPVLAPALA
jgi:magnesium transporter